MTVLIDTLVSILVNLFIGAFLLFAWAWNEPKGAVLRRLVWRFREQISWLGLRHDWSMFAPEPVRVERRLEAEVCLAGGEVIVWKAARLDQMSCWRAFLSARDRKYQTNLLQNRVRRLQPALAEYVARIHADRGLEVERVVLVRRLRLIPDPRAEEALLQPFERTVLYTHDLLAPEGASADAGHR